MKKLYTALLFSLVSLPVFAEMSQTTGVAQQQATQAVGISGSSVNQNFQASKVVAQPPQFGNSASSSAVPIFSGATATADQLVGPYEAAIDALGIDRAVYLTKSMIDEMELGITSERPLSFVHYAPVSDYMTAKYLSGNKHFAIEDHDVFIVPRFTNNLNLTHGKYLGLIYSTTLAGVSATDQDLKNAVISFNTEEILPYFLGRQVYLVKVPNGSGINVGVKTESLAKSLYITLASLLGSGSGGIGGSLTASNGDTRYSTTLGEQILVFVDDKEGGAPIHLDFSTQPKETAVAQETSVQPTSQTQEVVVRVKIDTNSVPLQQKASYVGQKRRQITINE
jgi:hypothetical protein